MYMLSILTGVALICTVCVQCKAVSCMLRVALTETNCYCVDDVRMSVVIYRNDGFSI